ncbi:MAG: DUF2182 domain-containing protein [Acidobacteria bacterium]|nr:DUF2182 domain-containing protein [Acidobacteriota bacterium]MBI3281201.1 DUF2182 domain-containing protein [Acidobacteriota bacterium]
MLSPLIPRVPVAERAALVACIALLAGAAWLGLGFSTDSRLFHLHHLDPGTTASFSFLLYFVVSWTVMTVAMMLPSTMPVLATLHAFAADRSNRVSLLGLSILGYLLAWAAFGGLVYAAFLLLKSFVLNGTWPWARALPGGALLLLMAGAFQFSSFKHKCLEKCRSPFSFVMEHWRGEQERWQAFRLGVDHGVFCVGCCWALMLLMFAVGAGSLLWMMVLAIVMAVEKTLPWGRRLSAPTGLALLAWGGIAILT